ncbi:MAG: UDP-N-acetylmuramoyl-L-alanine--D-glutamate ligase [Balneolaceae bacterium]
MRTVTDQHIAILGGARSGIAVARLLKKQGAVPFVSDTSPIREDLKTLLKSEGIEWEEGGHSDRVRQQASMVVVSPGIPDSAEIMKYHKREGTPVYSELEVADWFNQSPVIAVTGSNGKTTVTRWLEFTWQTAGRDVRAGGNIGLPYSDLISDSGTETTMILEVSSFQLDHIWKFRPGIGVILNITPDHLDRYEQNFDRYADAKLRLTENQQSSDLLIYNADDPVTAGRVEQLANNTDGPKIFAYSIRHEVDRGAFVRNDTIWFNLNGHEEKLMPIKEVGIPGTHNLGNGLATALVARVSEIRDEWIRESLKQFTGVEHRLEMVRELDGVRYVNDSKATNINAVWFALDSYQAPIVLILGGRDKGNDYRALNDQIRNKVHTIIGLGEARQAIKKQLKSVVPNYLEAGDMSEAVRLAKKQGKRGEIVLLSPACASFDMFENYEHRGDAFKEAVREL